MTMRKLDKDKDGKVSFSDYKSMVCKEPLLMEMFGSCLPNTRAGLIFLKQVLDTMPITRIYQE